MNLFNTLKERGYIYQATNEEEIKRILDSDKPVTFYLGIDPTANSLHIGHFFALMMFKYLQDAGHKGILLIGGATALIGDPSGKSDLRKMISKDEVHNNFEEVKKLAGRFIKTDGDNPAIILNNADWINSYSYIDFMRDIGIHFNVNKMLSAETYANRLKEGGLTFLEMGYMLMQSYDFVHLNKEYGCVLEIGGSDQWGNIIAGANLARKLHFLETQNKEDEDRDILFGLTCPLLMTKEGKKMGKTEKGALWVAREKTSSYDFYQYFYNVNDEDTEMLLKLFTFIDLDTINNLCKNNIIEAKRTMAYEITKLVHGKEEADKVLVAVDSLFAGGANLDDIPSIQLEEKIDEINIVELLVLTNFITSKSEARRMIEQGGIMIDDEKVEDVNQKIDLKKLDKDYLLLKKGKKNFLKVLI